MKPVKGLKLLRGSVLKLQLVYSIDIHEEKHAICMTQICCQIITCFAML